MAYINRLRQLRTQKGLSQQAVAEYLETTQQHYSCYENQKNEMPIRHLIALCKLYDVSADWLLGLQD